MSVIGFSLFRIGLVIGLHLLSVKFTNESMDGHFSTLFKLLDFKVH